MKEDPVLTDEEIAKLRNKAGNWVKIESRSDGYEEWEVHVVNKDTALLFAHTVIAAVLSKLAERSEPVARVITEEVPHSGQQRIRTAKTLPIGTALYTTPQPTKLLEVAEKARNKMVSALCCHPRAVPTLVEEARDILNSAIEANRGLG